MSTINRLARLSRLEHQGERDLERLQEREYLEEQLQDAQRAMRQDIRQDARSARKDSDFSRFDSHGVDQDRRAIAKQIRSIQHDISDVRLSTGTNRRNILQRMRRSEQRYNELYKKLTRKNPSVGVGTLYHPQTPRNKGALDVRVELSINGRHFSNPAPRVEPSSSLWVRVVITDTTTSDSAMDALPHELMHVKWRVPRGYVDNDPLGKWGHDVFFVSNPVIITRKFTAPSANTARNWMVIARLMQTGPDWEDEDYE